MSGPAQSELECHGQLPGAPVFHAVGGEIMTVVNLGDGRVQVFYEDADEPGRLIPDEMAVEDYRDLLAHQPQPPED